MAKVDPEPKRCAICDVRLSRVEKDHEDKHIRSEQAKRAAIIAELMKEKPKP